MLPVPQTNTHPILSPAGTPPTATWLHSDSAATWVGVLLAVVAGLALSFARWMQQHCDLKSFDAHRQAVARGLRLEGATMVLAGRLTATLVAVSGALFVFVVALSVRLGPPSAWLPELLAYLWHPSEVGSSTSHLTSNQSAVSPLHPLAGVALGVAMLVWVLWFSANDAFVVGETMSLMIFASSFLAACPFYVEKFGQPPTGFLPPIALLSSKFLLLTGFLIATSGDEIGRFIYACKIVSPLNAEPPDFINRGHFDKVAVCVMYSAIAGMAGAMASGVFGFVNDFRSPMTAACIPLVSLLAMLLLTLVGALLVGVLMLYCRIARSSAFWAAARLFVAQDFIESLPFAWAAGVFLSLGWVASLVASSVGDTQMVLPLVLCTFIGIYGCYRDIGWRRVRSTWSGLCVSVFGNVLILAGLAMLSILTYTHHSKLDEPALDSRMAEIAKLYPNGSRRWWSDLSFLFTR